MLEPVGVGRTWRDMTVAESDVLLIVCSPPIAVDQRSQL